MYYDLDFTTKIFRIIFVYYIIMVLHIHFIGGKYSLI